ncbi:MAG: type II toxin-antitoxin system PemK/MazF family toxin [Planctomycetaceae bacterium]|nr:type II toxin-antitoxin system PemK/MazF family toxin [Planctomycetaceae bacterium]
MVIRQGDIFWLDLPSPSGSEPGFRRPVLVVQNDDFNASKIATAVVCMLTSNLALGRAPGNVALAKGEASLSKRSVVNVSQVLTVDRSRLLKKIGTLSPSRVEEVLMGLTMLLRPSK